VVPSELYELYARVSYYDLKTRIQLRTEEKLADTMQTYETLCMVVSAALGGKRDAPPQADPASAPRTVNELEAKLKRVLG